MNKSRKEDSEKINCIPSLINILLTQRKVIF